MTGRIIIALFSLFASCGLHALPEPVELEVTVLEQDLSVKRYIADGEHLIIWVAPGYDTNSRVITATENLNVHDVEVWFIDLTESLFMPRTTSSVRKLDGKYLAELIEYAHKTTGKKITLVSRSYGAVPILRAIRLWQLRHHKMKVPPGDIYLKGAILFSPDLIESVPSLGLDATFLPVVDATNSPVVVFQAMRRGNRRQVDKLIERLKASGSKVKLNKMPGVTGVFYNGDAAEETLAMLASVPEKILESIAFLEKNSLTLNYKDKQPYVPKPYTGLDQTLKKFKGDPTPVGINMTAIDGKRYNISDYRGRVTVVNFWASWCPPCIEEIPSLNNLRREMSAKDFNLVSVNYAEDKKTIRQFLNKVDVDFPVLLDESGKVSFDWKVVVFPSTFIIGTDGKIKYGVNGAIHWDTEEVIHKLHQLYQ